MQTFAVGDKVKIGNEVSSLQAGKVVEVKDKPYHDQRVKVQWGEGAPKWWGPFAFLKRRQRPAVTQWFPSRFLRGLTDVERRTE